MNELIVTTNLTAGPVAGTGHRLLVNAVDCTLAGGKTLSQDQSLTCDYRVATAAAFGISVGTPLKGNLLLTWKDQVNNTLSRGGTFALITQAYGG
jgi:hypothetical protein